MDKIGKLYWAGRMNGDMKSPTILLPAGVVIGHAMVLVNDMSLLLDECQCRNATASHYSQHIVYEGLHEGASVQRVHSARIGRRTPHSP